MSKGNGGSGSGSTVTQTSTLDPTVSRNYSSLVGKATDAASVPYTNYTGELVAPFNTDQTSAFDTVSGLQGAYKPTLDKAQSYYDTSTKDLWSQLPAYSEDQIKKYENPYTDEVTNKLTNLYNSQNATQLSQVKGNAAALGAFGGDREKVAEAQTAGQQQLTEAPVLAGVREKGFTNAQDEFNKQQTTQLNALDETAKLNQQAGYGTAALGQEGQQLGLAGASAQLQSGGLKQSLAQEKLNVPYEQWAAEKAYPFQTSNFLAPIVEGTGSTSGGTSSTKYPAPSLASGLTGLGLTGLAGYGLAKDAIGSGSDAASTGSDFTGTVTGAEGGRIHYQNGGLADEPLPKVPNPLVEEEVDALPKSGGGVGASLPHATTLTQGSGSSGGEDGLAGVAKTALGLAPLIKLAFLQDGGRAGYEGGGLVVPPLPAIPTMSLDKVIAPGPEVKGAGPPKAPQGSSAEMPGSSYDPSKTLSEAKLVSDVLRRPGNASPSSSSDDTAGAAQGGQISLGGMGESDIHIPRPMLSRGPVGGYGLAHRAPLQYGGGPPSQQQTGVSSGGGMNPQTYYQQMMSMPIEQLQGYAARVPPTTPEGQVIQRALNAKRMSSGAEGGGLGVAYPMSGSLAQGSSAGYAEGGDVITEDPDMDEHPIVDHSGETVVIRYPSEGKELDLGIPSASGARQKRASGGYTADLTTGLTGLGTSGLDLSTGTSSTSSGAGTSDTSSTTPSTSSSSDSSSVSYPTLSSLAASPITDYYKQPIQGGTANATPTAAGGGRLGLQDGGDSGLGPDVIAAVPPPLPKTDLSDLPPDKMYDVENWDPGKASKVMEAPLEPPARSIPAGVDTSKFIQPVKTDVLPAPSGSAPSPVSSASPSGGGGAGLGDTVVKPQATDAMRNDTVNYWIGKGAPRHVAEGIADRVNAESGFDPRLDAPDKGGPSAGLYQAHLDRRTSLQSLPNWQNPQVQHDWAYGQVTGGDPMATAHWDEIKNAPTREAAAQLWDKYFERSAAGPGSARPRGYASGDPVILPGLRERGGGGTGEPTTGLGGANTGRLGRGLGNYEPVQSQPGMGASPWIPWLAAGLGIMGGRSPYPLVNSGQGGLQGIQALQTQENERIRAQNIDARAQHLADLTQVRQNAIDQSSADKANALQEKYTNLVRLQEAGDRSFGLQQQIAETKRQLGEANALTRAAETQRKIDTSQRALDIAQQRANQMGRPIIGDNGNYFRADPNSPTGLVDTGVKAPPPHMTGQIGTAHMLMQPGPNGEPAAATSLQEALAIMRDPSDTSRQKTLIATARMAEGELATSMDPNLMALTGPARSAFIKRRGLEIYNQTAHDTQKPAVTTTGQPASGASAAQPAAAPKPPDEATARAGAVAAIAKSPDARDRVIRQMQTWGYNTDGL
jgi:hypothetical protein